MTDIVLIGAGGHARMVVDALQASGIRIALVIDPIKPAWLDAEHSADDTAIPAAASVVIGIGGVTLGELRKRLALLQALTARGHQAPTVIHPSAVVSSSATIGPGSQIAAAAIVQAFARIGTGVIVNTGAIVEHDAAVGDGCHIAPGAIVLGGAVVGATSMIGAGAVVLPQAHVVAGSMVNSLTRFPTAGA